jgi:formylglycine-generating enzyme required for sulfatase activity
MVWVEGGEFMMGSNNAAEKPPHWVEVSGFLMAEFEVTQELYRGVTGESPSNFKGDRHPVERINWYQATEFCNKLNQLLALDMPYSGKEDTTQCNFCCTAFRLPTEAEWEFAARGGKKAKKQYKYAGSDNIDDVAWCSENNDYETKPVGLKFPNALGLYDMSGNVWEWCWDRYGEDYYEKCNKNGLIPNPEGPQSGSHRVLRGGSWGNGADYSRVASRYDGTPVSHWGYDGFRLLFALQFTSEQKTSK